MKRSGSIKWFIDESDIVLVCVYVCECDCVVFILQRKCLPQHFCFQGWHGSLCRFPINNYVCEHHTSLKYIKVCENMWYPFLLILSVSLSFSLSFLPLWLILSRIDFPAGYNQSGPFMSALWDIRGRCLDRLKDPMCFWNRVVPDCAFFPLGCGLICLCCIFG